MAKINIKFNNKNYSIDPASLADATARLETHLAGMMATSTPAAGLYQTGAIALYEEQGASAVEGMMIKSWDELVNDGTIVVDSNKCLTADSKSKKTVLTGDLVMPDDESITSIGKNTFYGCGGLSGITIPNSVTSIGSYAFGSCTELTSITIPDSVTSIGTPCFTGCYKLVEIINHSTLSITAGTGDYGDIARYAKEVHTGTSKIVNQNNYLFYTYDGINYLLKYIGTDTELMLPESYNGQNYQIYEYAFYLCSNLISITIPNSITIIPDYCFSGCSNITDMTIGNSVVRIDKNAFQNCDSLASITIPGSVGYIGTQSFASCDNLSKMYYTGTTSKWKSLTKGSNWNYRSPVSEIHCSDGVVAL